MIEMKENKLINKQNIKCAANRSMNNNVYSPSFVIFPITQ